MSRTRHHNRTFRRLLHWGRAELRWMRAHGWKTKRERINEIRIKEREQ